jgi:hypothetical protein
VECDSSCKESLADCGYIGFRHSNLSLSAVVEKSVWRREDGSAFLAATWASTAGRIYQVDTDELSALAMMELGFDAVALWGRGDDEIYAAGSVRMIVDSEVQTFGRIARFDGAGWTLVEGIPEGPAFTDLWGNGDNLWAAGVAGRVLHEDGAGWKDIALGLGTDDRLAAVVATSAGDVVVANCSAPGGACETAPRLWRRDVGGNWSAPFMAPGGAAIYDFWSDGEVVYGVGSGGTVCRVQGTSCVGEETPTTEDLLAISGSLDNLFAVGKFGTVLRFDGGSWRSLVSETDDHFVGVHVNSAGEMALIRRENAIFAGGAYSVADGAAFYEDHSYSGFVTPASFFAVDDSTIFFGSTFAPYQVMQITDSGAQDTGYVSASAADALWGRSAAEIYAMARVSALPPPPNYLQRFDGSNWFDASPNVDPPGAPLGLTGDTDRLVIIGTAGTVLLKESGTWTDVSLGTEAGRVYSAWTGSGELYVLTFAGEDGAIFRRDSNTWTQVFQAPQLTGLWGAAPNDIWAVSAAGFAYHYDGSAWTQTAQLQGTGYIMLAGTGSGDVFAASRAVLSHFNGSSWSRVRLPTEIPILHLSPTPGRIFLPGFFSSTAINRRTPW